jgi:iron complex outermembrane recepter protein
MLNQEREMKKGYRFIGRIFCGILLGGFATGGMALAQDENTTLETVVVTGTRTPERVRKIPASITVVDEEEIRNSMARTVPDLLRNQEGIVVRDLLGNGKAAQVDMRGFGESAPFNVLVLVDGRRVNEMDLSGVDWTQIPLEQIERIEIVRGTGTVLYGDNAVGGVINIITKLPGRTPTFRTGVTLGSYGRHKEEVAVSGGVEKVAASLFASYDSTDGYRENNDFRARDVGGRVVYDPTSFLSLNLSGSYHSDNYGLPGPLTRAELEEDRRGTTAPFDNAESTDYYLKLGSELDLGTFGSLLADFSYRSREFEDRFFSDFGDFLRESETETWAITPRWILNSTPAGYRNTFVAGIDVYLSEMEMDSVFGGFPSGFSNVERNSYGAYFNNDFSVRENLVLSLGARRERVRYDLVQEDLSGFLAPLEDRITDWENAYTAGLTFLYGEKSSLFARYNRSFRFPLTDELVLLDFAEGQIRVNPALSPQRGNHYEVGMRHFFTSSLQGNVTLFRAEIKDEIFLNLPTFTNENHPETLHQGVELGFRADFSKRFTLLGNYTYEKARFEADPYEGNDIPAVPRHRGSLGFRLFDLTPGLTLAADYNYVGASYAISDQPNVFGRVESYYTLDGRISYAWRAVRAFAGVNNITNQKYSQYVVASATQLNFYPAPERNWIAGLEFRF